MTTYKITLEVSSDTPVEDWVMEDVLIIDEPYKVISVREVTE